MSKKKIIFLIVSVVILAFSAYFLFAKSPLSFLKKSGSKELSVADIKDLQEYLNSVGCNAGTPDGIVGSKTTSAVQCALAMDSVSNKKKKELKNLI